MKILSCFVILVLLFNSGLLFSQQNTYDIHLSKPGEPGFLEVDIYNASILVKGSDKDHVVWTIHHNRKGGVNYGAADLLYDVTELNNKITILVETFVFAIKILKQPA